MSAVKSVFITVIAFLIGAISGIIFWKHFDTCGEWVVDNKTIPMPKHYREITGCDSIQLVLTDTWIWSVEESKAVPADGHLEAIFCCYNNLKRDTVKVSNNQFHIIRNNADAETRMIINEAADRHVTPNF